MTCLLTPDDDPALVEDSTVRLSTALRDPGAGGTYIADGPVTIRRTIVSGNESSLLAPGTFAGGLMIDEGSTTAPTIERCTVVENRIVAGVGNIDADPALELRDLVWVSSSARESRTSATWSVYDVRPTACGEYPHTDKPELVTRTMGVAANTLTCPAVYRVVERMRERARGRTPRQGP